MNEVAESTLARPAAPTILFEANNLTTKAGTGIATYARTIAQTVGRLGYQADGLFGVSHGLSRRSSHALLNEIKAFDAVPEDKQRISLGKVVSAASYPFRALAGIRPIEVSRSGLVINPLAGSLAPFRRIYGVTQLIEASKVHFTLYGRFAQLKLAEAPHLFHATSVLPIAVKGCPNVYTVHDLVPLRLPYTTLDDKKYFFRLLKKIADTADHVVTVSEYSRRDIIEQLGIAESRVTNTYQTVDIPRHILDRSDDEIARDLETTFGLELGGYFIFYGAIEPKKNLSRLIDAYAGSGSTLPLILAGGGGWQNREELRKIRDERFASFRVDRNVIRRERQVRRLEYLPNDQLMTLVQGARALLFPSIYEGFGLPVIEAMALGTPVVTSTAASLPEIAGDAALLVDPYSTEAIRRAIHAVEVDSDLRRNLSRRGREQAMKFAPAAYEARLLELYEMMKI